MKSVGPKQLLDIPAPLLKLLPFLENLLQRVSLGQRAGDSTALLQAVRQLSDAPDLTSLGGGGVNSDRLLEEATEIAWQQRDPDALRESLVLWSAPVRASRSQEKIRQTKERIENVESERQEMLQKKRCRIVFHNRTERPIEVFVNRKPVGTLSAGQKHIVGDMLAGRQYLGANDKRLEWGPRKVYIGPGEVFNWRLFD